MSQINFISFLKNQSTERYKTIIIYSKPLLGKTTFAKQYAKKINAKYIDFLDYVVEREDLKNKIDRFYSEDLKSILKKIEKTKEDYIFIDNFDFILNIWPKKDLEGFLNIVEKYHSKKTIIFFVQERKFLKKRNIYNTYGQNRIINIYKLKQF